MAGPPPPGPLPAQVQLQVGGGRGLQPEPCSHRVTGASLGCSPQTCPPGPRGTPAGPGMCSSKRTSVGFPGFCSSLSGDSKETGQQCSFIRNGAWAQPAWLSG